MLILKGKFPNFKFSALFGAVLMLAALAWMGVSQVRAAPVAGARVATAPDAVASEFYGWYLDTLGADQDPLSDRHAVFKRYVASTLTARLIEGLNGGRVPERDYFLQSPGYESVWRRHVAATTVRQRGDNADVIVTLGEEGGAKRVLALAMVREAGSWKIRQVVLAEARSAKVPATRPSFDA